MHDRALLVSVKPDYAEMILRGTKTVELRRVRPRVAAGCRVLIYASAPSMELVGSAVLEGIQVARPPEIWQRFGGYVGIDLEEFDAYFQNADVAVALHLKQAKRFQKRIPLVDLRSRLTGHCPPQSFRYVALAEAAAFA